jgi:hypothetical protein
MFVRGAAHATCNDDSACVNRILSLLLHVTSFYHDTYLFLTNKEDDEGEDYYY